MLKEIRCDMLSAKIPNKTISFHGGLNAIVGMDDATNSIGKSTALLLVDFCFGGDSYADQKSDIIKNVGNHTVYFTFSFNDGDFYFARKTDDFRHYFVCDKNYNLGERKSIGEFREFLKRHYFSPSSSQTFSALVSPFMRVSGKNNYDIKKPFKTYSGEDDKKGITLIENLFDVYGLIEKYEREHDEAVEEKKAVDSARKHSLLFTSIQNKGQLEAARENLISLKAELNQDVLDESRAKMVSDASLLQEDIDLKVRLSVLSQQKRKALYHLKSLQKATGESLLMNDEDKKNLQFFFPGAEIKPLEQINEFHQKLLSNVNQEVAMEKERLESLMRSLDMEIASIQEKLNEHNVTPNISKSFLESMLKKHDEITALEKQIETYEKVKKASEKVKETDLELNVRASDVLKGIENIINPELARMNECVYKQKRLAPELHFQSCSKYSFVTPNDSSTGSMFKSLLLLDLALLKTSQLPVLIHDSLLFKNIWDEPVEGLFRLYSSFQKQIFVSIDRINVFDAKTQTTISSSMILKLGDGEDALFGRSWARNAIK